MYNDPWLDIAKDAPGASGIHYFSKQRLCQYTQSEQISTTTGAGQCVLESLGYSFGSRLLGQHAMCAKALQPDQQGFHKRYFVAAAPCSWQPSTEAETLPNDMSKQLIQAVHEYMANAGKEKQVILLDGHALTVFRHIGRVIESWLQTNNCSAFFKAPASKLLTPQKKTGQNKKHFVNDRRTG